MKERLRSSFLKKRNAQSFEDLKKLSKRIISFFTSSDIYKENNSFFIYVSKDNEVYTHDLIKSMLVRKTVCVPCIDDKRMVCSRINSFDDLKKGCFSILEPKDIRLFSDPDVIIIPGVVFDDKGNRIGMGKGYYDSYLKKTKSLKVGFAFSFQMSKNIPIQEHDVPVDIIITEKNIHYINKKCLKLKDD